MIFHLEIPSQDLDESAQFYQRLGASVLRDSGSNLHIDFFGHHLVCRISDKIEPVAKMHPRHFGIIFEKETEFFDFYQMIKVYIPEYIFEPYFCEDLFTQYEVHKFYLDDPSNNVIEFKWYKNAWEPVK